MKLKKDGLKLDGSQVTKGRDYGQSRLKELISNAQHLGLEVPNPPTGPISYTLLIRDLSALGLITGTIFPCIPLNLILLLDSDDPFPHAASSQQSLDASSSRHSLDDAHLPVSLKVEVNSQDASESVRDVMHGPSDGMAMDSQDFDSEVLSLGDSGLELGSNLDSLARGTIPDDVLNEAFPRPASDDRLVLDLQKEVASLSSRLLRAESDSGGQFGDLSSDLPRLVRSAVSDGFADMEHEHNQRIGLEIRSEVSRMHESLASELSCLRDFKRATDTHSTQLKNFGSSLTEIVGVQVQLQRAVNVLTTRVDTFPTSISNEIQSKLSTPLGVKFDTLSRLVRSNQQNAPGSTSTPSKTAPSPSAPSPVPRAVKECHICGRRDHTRTECPRKQDWCVRCSRYGHRHSTCQDRDLECELCLSQGRPSLALGHHK